MPICFSCYGRNNQDFEKVRTKAKAQANREQFAVAIYKTTYGEYKYIEAGAAAAAGYTISEMVLPDYGTAAQ